MRLVQSDFVRAPHLSVSPRIVCILGPNRIFGPYFRVRYCHCTAGHIPVISKYHALTCDRSSERSSEIKWCS